MSPAAFARVSAGLSPEQAAMRARVSIEYLARLESAGGFPYALACRLSRLYGNAPLDLFLKTSFK